jgi:hypothetical protein
MRTIAIMKARFNTAKPFVLKGGLFPDDHVVIDESGGNNRE